jgi:hypothetical protein
MAPAFFQDSWGHARIAVVLATVAVVSSCAQPSTPAHSLQQVRAENPSVTYAYSGDEELLKAAQNAETFCGQFNSMPGPAKVETDTTGAKSAIFECGLRTAPVVATQPAAGPNLSYSYRSDEELLAAARTADNYCANSRTHAVVSTITPNTDGSKTAVFQCRV